MANEPFDPKTVSVEELAAYSQAASGSLDRHRGGCS